MVDAYLNKCCDHMHALPPATRMLHSSSSRLMLGLYYHPAVSAILEIVVACRMLFSV